MIHQKHRLQTYQQSSWFFGTGKWHTKNVGHRQLYKEILSHRHWWNTRIFLVTKIWYPVKIQFLPSTCEDITVVMTTSVSANRKSSQHCTHLPFSFTNQSSWKQDGIFKSTTKFPHNYFWRRAQRKDGWKVCSNDSKVDNLIKTGEKRNSV